MTAETIARALGGRKAGCGWTAHCPAHHDRTPSLSIRDADDGRILVHCHAGCAQERVITALRARGLWSQVGRRSGNMTGAQSGATNLPDRGNDERTRAALSLWETTVTARSTLVETYLDARNIVIPIPDALRFHAAIKHPSGQRWPAMVALVARGTDGKPIAVHRTFLGRDGSSKAPIDPQKMMFGPCRGGAVRLGEPGDVLMVGEGIETCLAAVQATGQPAWAALSTSGLRSLDLPAALRDVIVLADGDEAGEAAARDAALRWKRQGRRVRVARPPRGMDFNDMLLGHAPCIEGGVQ